MIKSKSTFLFLLPFIIIIAGILFLYITIITNRKNGLVSSAYTRVTNCVISKNATSRSQGDIEKCYSVIENEFNLKLKRYDKL